MNHTTGRRCLFGVALAASLLIVALCPTAKSAAQSDDALFAEVLAAWQKRQQEIRTVRVSWAAKNTTPKGAITQLFGIKGKGGEVVPLADVTHDAKATLVIDGLKARLKSEQMIWDQPTEQFQKQTIDSCYEDGKNSRLINSGILPWPTGTIDKTRWNQDCDITTWPIRAAFRGLDADVMNRVELSNFTITRHTVLERREMIELIRERAENRGESKIWVEEAQDYAAHRYETYAKDGTTQQRITVIQRKDPSGMWVPASWNVVVHNKNKMVRAASVSVTELALNPPTTSDEFHPVFPPGTKVFDSTGEKPRQYIEREGKTPREILPGERGLPYDDLIQSESGDLLPGGKPTFFSRNRTALIIAGIVLILGAAVLLVLRFRHPSRTIAGEQPGPVA